MPPYPGPLLEASRAALGGALQRLGQRIAPAASASGEEANWRLIAENSFDVAVRFDRNWRRVYVSPAVCDVLGYSPGEYMAAAWRDGVHPDELHALADAVKRLERGAYSATATYRRQHRDGSLVWLESTFRRLPPGHGYVAVLRDVTARKRVDEQVRHMAHHDALTGLGNRVQLNARLDQAIAGAANGRVAVLALDLDRFKAVNDLFGHGAGDRLLQQASDRLRGSTRPDDLVVRLGGDEFAVVRAGADHAEAEALAATVADRVARPFDLGGRSAEVGVSIGIALHPGDGATTADLLRNADAAVYAAKRGGKSYGAQRGRWNFFEHAMETRRRERALLDGDLRAALDDGHGLALHFQPIHAADGAVVAQEALLRWTHPERGPIPPADFIPLAEESDLIILLGRWVLDAACAEAARWPKPWRVAVNLSPVQFACPDLSTAVAGALRRAGLPGERLELEVTEGVLINDTDRVLGVMEALRAQGVGFALDDFGTGYSSLGTLRRFPFERLKIDRSFVRDLERDGEALAVVQSIVALAAALRLRVVAEGVETPAQLDMLRRLGCQEMQGFLLGRPVPADWASVATADERVPSLA